MRSLAAVAYSAQRVLAAHYLPAMAALRRNASVGFQGILASRGNYVDGLAAERYCMSDGGSAVRAFGEYRFDAVGAGRVQLDEAPCEGSTRMTLPSKCWLPEPAVQRKGGSD
jgi:hypothetical protein